MTSAPSPMLGVQGAIISLLRGDAALLAMVGVMRGAEATPASTVYDFVPEQVPYPFVVVGEAIETPDNRHGGFGRQTVPTLHVWDQYRGYTRVLRIGSGSPSSWTTSRSPSPEWTGSPPGMSSARP